MIKNILLAGTMMVAAPVLAQTAPATARTGAATAQTSQTAGTSAATPAATASRTPQATAGVTPVTQPATDTTATAQATPGAATSAASPSQQQVAQVVDQQFTTYDKDGNGALSKAEFSAWMTALKSSSPAAGKESPAQQTAWNEAAFKQADGDKSSTVSKTELTGFLVKGASQAS